MADYQQIVEQIRAFLQGSDQTRNERLEGLAIAFAEASAEVNQRLIRCQRLLQQGLRSEAIQLAESEPRLLDAVTTLDFLERNEWDELIEIYSLGAAPKLMAEARVALNEAYAEAEPLQNLLRTHRRLATQRASVRTRIAVMRKLAAQDARNPIWPEDLRAFEKIRFRQIQVEAAEAVRLHDAAHLARLLSEVRDPAWIETPSKALVGGLAKADVQLRREQARTALVDIEASLSDALTASDPIRGRTARDEWTALTATVPVEPDDPCWKRITPALEWLEEEDRRSVANEAYETDLAALSSALEERRDISAAELERLERQVLRHTRGMPEKVQRRYATRFRSASASRTRRFRVIVAAAIAALIFAGGLLSYVIRDMGRSRDANQAAAKVAGLLENGDFEQATNYLDDLEKADPSLLELPVLIQARQNCKTARDRATERDRKFQDAMDEAKRSKLDEVEPKSLTTAGSLAWLEPQKQAVAQLTQQRDAARKVLTEKRDTSMVSRLDAIINEVDQLGATLDVARLDETRFQDELDRLRTAFRALANEVDGAGADPQRLAGALKQKLETVSMRFETVKHRSQLMDEITRTVAFSVSEQSDNLVRFASRLQEFANANPGEPCSAVFKETLKERPMWDAVAAWNDLVGGWKNPRSPLTPPEAAVREKACGEFLTKHPGFAEKTNLVRYRTYLQAIVRRGSGDDGPTGALKTLFSHPLIADCWMVKLKRQVTQQFPKRYYTRKEPTVTGSSAVFFVAGEEKPVRREIELEDIDSRSRSPQSDIASSFKKLFTDDSMMDQREWESSTIELVRKIITNREMEPVLQLSLLKTVVKAAGDGSEPIRLTLLGITDRLENTKVNLSVDWTNPDDRNLVESQTGALEVIESVRKKIPTPGEVQHVRDDFERIVRQTYRTVGWLIRNGNGYDIRHGVGLPGDGDLSIIAPSADKRWEWKRVGAITGAKVNLDTNARSALIEGRPVFAVITTY